MFSSLLHKTVRFVCVAAVFVPREKVTGFELTPAGVMSSGLVLHWACSALMTPTSVQAAPFHLTFLVKYPVGPTQE